MVITPYHTICCIPFSLLLSPQTNNAVSGGINYNIIIFHFGGDVLLTNRCKQVFLFYRYFHKLLFSFFINFSTISFLSFLSFFLSFSLSLFRFFRSGDLCWVGNLRMELDDRSGQDLDFCRVLFIQTPFLVVGLAETGMTMGQASMIVPKRKGS